MNKKENPKGLLAAHINHFKPRFQYVLLDDEGYVVESSDAIVKLSELENESVFDLVPFLESLKDTLQFLEISDEPLWFPRLEFPVLDAEGVFDFSFRRFKPNESEQSYIVWCIEDNTKHYDYLFQVQQERNDSMISREWLDIKNRQIIALNEEINRKNQEITDSILYAKRIQEALLPPEKNLQTRLKDSFILYKAKDIVSGDFYWLSVKPDVTLVAVVDCTGHGVPGAFMSVLGNTALNQIANVENITQPKLILEALNKDISQLLNKYVYQHQEGYEKIEDGMDVALCCIHHKERKVTFAGAKRSLCLVRKGEIMEYKGNIFPIGGFFKNDEKEFNEHSLDIENDDMLYIFSDGYADQFGGADEKKFMSLHFKKLLQRIAHLSAKEQKDALDKTIEEWRGNIPQTDDILVIGLRL